MSDQEDFDQQLTPSQEHTIAFAVILLFGAMYLFFMKGCQPIASSIGQAFGPPQAVHLSPDQHTGAVNKPTVGGAIKADRADDKSSGQPEENESETATPDIIKAQTIVAGDETSTDANADQQALIDAKARDDDAARIKSEAASLAAATAAQKLADEKRFEAKQVELQAAKAELAIPAKPIETASTSQPQISPKLNKQAEKPVESQVSASTDTQANKPFNMADEIARDSFMLPDGRNVQIPQQGFESSFKKSILQGSKNQPIVFDRVYFYPGSDLLNPESSNQILGAAGIMNTYKDINVTLRGHTDSTGPAEDNLTLSFKRSLNLKKQLVGLGIDTNRIQVEGLGSSEPISDNDSEKGRNKNRRIDLTIIR